MGLSIAPISLRENFKGALSCDISMGLLRILGTVLNRIRQVYLSLMLTAHLTAIETFSATADCLLIHLTITALKYCQKSSLQQLPFKKSDSSFIDLTIS